MSVVLDASVTLDWCFDSEQSPYGEAALQQVLASQGVVPPIWPSEVANGLLSRFRRRLLTVASLAQVTSMLSKLPIEVAAGEEVSSIGRLVQSGREFSLTAYDASYLALAMARGLPLATKDGALVKAAHKAGVPIFEPVSKGAPIQT